MLEVAVVALGGAVGSVLRYLAGRGAAAWLGLGFPFGTLFVNLTGSFAMGVVIELLARRLEASETLRLLLATGLLGGYTTFSSFSLDVAAIYERGEVGLAAFYVAVSVAGGIAALFCGLWVARTLA